MPRIRDLHIYQSSLLPGLKNAITDVPGVAVGHYTLIQGDGVWTGNGPFRTGITLILPHTGNLYEDKVAAAVHTINGFGKVAGFEQVRELGTIETAVALTSTLNVPRVADALMTVAIEQNPHIGLGFAETGRQGYASVNPVVGETSDGFLSDMQARPLGEAAVRAALADASSGPVTEGVVGAGAGTSCYGWKGGIGTASRVLPSLAAGFTVGALVQTNFGSPEELLIAGVPVGKHVQPPEKMHDQKSVADDHPLSSSPLQSPNGGSIMIVLATDAPFDSRQLGRLCQRAAFGLARTGSTCHGGSGDFVIAFSTSNRIPDRPPQIQVSQSVVYEQPLLNIFSLAVIEVVEEAIYNSLFMAHTVVGRDGHTRYGLPVDEVVAVMRQYGR